jgi:hypothetical protein
MKAWPIYNWLAMAAAGIGAYPALLWAQIGLVTLFVPWCGGSRPAEPSGQDWLCSCSAIPTIAYLLPLLSLAMIVGGAYFFFFAILFGGAVIVASAACYMAATSIVFQGPDTVNAPRS